MNGLFSFLNDILSPINPFSENFILGDVLKDLASLMDWLNPFSENFFVYKLIELLGDLLKWLFVPSEDSINALVNDVKNHFRFVDTIQVTVKYIEDMFVNTENLPVIKITLSQNDWYNGEVTVLDLRWYAQYKEYGDLIISAFIYIFFIWRIYVKLPGIISGSSGAITDTIYKGSDIESFIKKN